MRSSSLAVVFLFWAWGAQGQSAIQASVTAPPYPWTKQDVAQPESFRFVILADRCGGHRDGVFEKAIRKVNLLRPDLVLCVGDLIEGYTENMAELTAMYADLDNALAGLDAPFFFVTGNHDVTNPTMMTFYRQHRGPTYYHFRYQDTLFVVLCSEDGDNGADGFSQAQLDRVKKALADNQDVRWTFFFLHKPLWKSGLDCWTALEAEIGDRPCTLFAGHEHQYCKYERNGREYYMLATSGGDSELVGADAGSLDHVTLVSVGGDRPQVVNLALEGILPDDLVTDQFIAQYGSIESQARPVIETLLLDETMPREAKTVFSFINGVRMPAAVTALFPPDQPIDVTPAVSQFQVAPMGKHEIEIGIRPKSPDQMALPLFAHAEVQAAFTPDGGRVRHMKRRSLFAVDRRFYCPATATPISIDGKLDDWPEKPIELNGDRFKDPTSTTNWTGPEDSSGRFGVAWDTQYVYFCAEVRDAEIVTRPGHHALEQDGVGFFVDMNPDPQNRRARIDLAVGLSVGQHSENPFTGEPTPDTIRTACVQTPTGYTAELAFPVSLFQQKQGENWTGFRGNIAINDVDADGRALLWWRPSWDSSLLYPGSGLFTRK